MISIQIPLSAVIVNPTEKPDWSSLSEEGILILLGQVYAFLPQPIAIALEEGIAHINSPFDSQSSRRTMKVLEKANNSSVGRPHIAQVMLENGIVSSYYEAFNKYIGNGLPAFEKILMIRWICN